LKLLYGQSSFQKLEERFPDAGKYLKIIFNKFWEGSFPNNWNSASIVSIPKKADLSNGSNYKSISLIVVALKIKTKIITEFQNML
jgi:hypothetical protein